jgi:hypothetical protein
MRLLLFIVSFTIVEYTAHLLGYKYAREAAIYGISAVLGYEYLYLWDRFLRLWVYLGHFCEKYLKATKEFQ